MPLYDYQAELVARVKGAVSAGEPSILVVLPTGGGKTVVAAELITWLCSQGKTGIMVAPRSDLVRQASSRLLKEGISHGLIAGWAKREDAQVHVGTAAAVARRGATKADFALIDEAHLGHKRPGCQLEIGLTATPVSGLGERLPGWKRVVCGPSYQELVYRGVLVQPRIFAPAAPDHRQARFSGKEFSKDTLNTQMMSSGVLTRCVDHWRRHADGMSTVAFCVSVDHANRVAAEFTNSGIPAMAISADTPLPERERIYGHLRDGGIKVLANCEVIGLGWDLPQLQCVMLMRPTASLALFIQMCGRGSRAAEGKPSYLLLDLAGNVLLHGSPSAPREWADLPSATAPHATPDITSAAPSFRCQVCFFVHDKRLSACASCGAAMTAVRAIRYRNGKLTEMASDFIPPEQQVVATRNKRRKQLICIGKFAKRVANPVQWAQGVLSAFESGGAQDWDLWLREQGILKRKG